MLVASRHGAHPRRRAGAGGNGVADDLALPLAGGLALLLAFVTAAAVLSGGDRREKGDRHRDLPGGAAGPRVAILSAPLPPPDGSPERQELAVRSWLALPGNVSVVLLAAHPSAHALAGRLGGRVTVDAAIDISFTGTPFFHSIVARAQAADSDICVLVDAEIILLPETITLLKHFSRSDLDWFVFSVSRNISAFPYHLVDNGTQWVDQHGNEVSFKKEIQSDKWAGHGSDRGLIVAWNNPSSRMIAGVMPSFLNGKGVHNWWLIHEVLSSETRLVFDASNLVLGLYPENFSEKRGMNTSRNASNPDGSWPWEYDVNRHLAAVYGSYCYDLPRRNSPMVYKVVKQFEDYLFSKNEEPNLSNSVINKEPNVHPEGGRLCKKEISYSSAVNLPHSLEMLLELVADKNRSVVLAVAGASYRDMLMSWVCRLRRLRVTNFVVCALDQETHEFSVLQGMPVFRDPLSPKNVSFDDCHFGTQCFQQVTKVKSRIVLKILRLGYNVLLSDVDVYWFHNPVSFLHSLGPGTFAAQSDEYNQTGPINMPRRLNSGFYYARSDDATITAMEKIVKHAINSGLSEQPSFYDILCGKDGANRVGDDRCLEPSTNLTVVFLRRDMFPNGAYGGLWEKKHGVSSACRELGCLIIHNNWVNGRRKKLHRQMASGLWDYDPGSRLCLQNWSNASRFSVQTDAPVSYDS
uniref:Nucleotide-diphospho-sugar transferase domain-containing protein n=1 Tax=Oryza meridionalis TaxID=40149 RepID=A0A0E0DTU3_9ORYZ